MGDCQNEDLRVGFDRRLKLKFLGSQVTTDAGLLAYRELDETLGLTDMAQTRCKDSRAGSNKQHGLSPLLRQSIYSRLAGYEDVNDAERLQSPYSQQSRRTTNCPCGGQHRNRFARFDHLQNVASHGYGAKIAILRHKHHRQAAPWDAW